VDVVSEMRVLIVDDDGTFCRLLAEILESKGHQVEWTTHGVQGYEMSVQGNYDLLVFDVRMPLLLGTDLAEGLKDQSPGSKIILISAFADQALQRSAQRLGVPLLSKPFTTNAFLDLIERITDSKQNV